jgi:predicted nucleic-acid-binding protein
MMTVERRWSTSQIETTLRELKSVCGAKIITDEQGLIQEVHLLIEGERTPKQVVRDVESALLAHFGLNIDHRKISVAQKEAGSKISGDARLRWLDVQITHEGTRAVVLVIVEYGGKTFTGSVTGVRSSTNIPRLLATATLRAVEAAYGLQERFALEDLSSNLMLAGRQVVVAMINALTDTGEDLLIGSAIVRQDLHRAVVSATLDALNRRVTSLPTDSQEGLPIEGQAAVNLILNSPMEGA